MKFYLSTPLARERTKDKLVIARTKVIISWWTSQHTTTRHNYMLTKNKSNLPISYLTIRSDVRNDFCLNSLVNEPHQGVW